MADCQNGIDAHLGTRPVRSLAANGDVKEYAARHNYALPHGEGTHVHAGAIVHALDDIAGKALEQAIVQRGQCAATTLLSRLKDEN